MELSKFQDKNGCGALSVCPSNKSHLISVALKASFCMLANDVGFMAVGLGSVADGVVCVDVVIFSVLVLVLCSDIVGVALSGTTREEGGIIKVLLPVVRSLEAGMSALVF